VKVVFELDLMDDPVETEVRIITASVEDYDRIKRLYPADPGQIGEGERTYQHNGARYFVTTAWTEAKGRVELQVEEPKSLDAGDITW
jgi:hypothetical protein